MKDRKEGLTKRLSRKILPSDERAPKDSAYASKTGAGMVSGVVLLPEGLMNTGEEAVFLEDGTLRLKQENVGVPFSAIASDEPVIIVTVDIGGARNRGVSQRFLCYRNKENKDSEYQLVFHDPQRQLAYVPVSESYRKWEDIEFRLLGVGNSDDLIIGHGNVIGEHYKRLPENSSNEFNYELHNAEDSVYSGKFAEIHADEIDASYEPKFPKWPANKKTKPYKI